MRPFLATVFLSLYLSAVFARTDVGSITGTASDVTSAIIPDSTSWNTATAPSANLNGTPSDDGLPAGRTLTTAWSKVSGPGTVPFGNASGSLTTPGTLSLSATFQAI